jgi:hypothetical protein
VTEQVIADLRARTELGIAKYGRPLETFNGRNALRDLYEELLDGAQYVKQRLLEEDDLLRVMRPVGLWLQEVLINMDAAGDSPARNDATIYKYGDIALKVGAAREFVDAVKALEGVEL